MDENQRPHNRAFLADCERIHREWHERAKARDSDGLLALYAEDAVLETPLAQAIFDGRPNGTLRGHREIRPFFEKGARRLPNDLARWHRSSRTESDCLFGSIRARRRTAIKWTLSRSWRLPMASFNITEFIGAGSEPPC